ncbi:MAG TPA: DUF4197 domain-containing protein [Oligoflexia bacterium]|nr:DUF4197 domain-containing protein [Oligoflexia bacterium]HMR23766.1 DUF4197 domain-containing protein [Oligoflexia bacterium]
MIRNTLLLLCTVLLLHCAETSDFLKQAGASVNGLTFSEEEMSTALKQALSIGTDNSVQLLSSVDGYYKDDLFKITFPNEASKVESTLRSLGMSSLVDKTILSLNRAAEAAASEAKPIFLDAIKQMTLKDARNIVLGSEHAATDYFKTKTQTQLSKRFSPIIENKLDAVNANQYWKTVMSNYNKIPTTKAVETNLTAYVTQRAIDGMFLSVAQEEEKIRENPALRTTKLLKQVFAYADANKN